MPRQTLLIAHPLCLNRPELRFLHPSPLCPLLLPSSFSLRAAIFLHPFATRFSSLLFFLLDSFFLFFFSRKKQSFRDRRRNVCKRGWKNFRGYIYIYILIGRVFDLFPLDPLTPSPPFFRCQFSRRTMEGVREPSPGTRKSLPFDRLFLLRLPFLRPPKQISLRRIDSSVTNSSLPVVASVFLLIKSRVQAHL